jgi:hypothetical protein
MTPASAARVGLAGSRRCSVSGQSLLGLVQDVEGLFADPLGRSVALVMLPLASAGERGAQRHPGAEGEGRAMPLLRAVGGHGQEAADERRSKVKRPTYPVGARRDSVGK